MIKNAFKFAAIAWFGLAAILFIELVQHMAEGTSDFKSQGFRLLFVCLYLVLGCSLWIRSRRVVWLVVTASAIVGLRNYFLLAVPREIAWTLPNVFGFLALLLSLLSVALVIWERRQTNRV